MRCELPSIFALPCPQARHTLSAIACPSAEVTKLSVFWSSADSPRGHEHWQCALQRGDVTCPTAVNPGSQTHCVHTDLVLLTNTEGRSQSPSGSLTPLQTILSFFFSVPLFMAFLLLGVLFALCLLFKLYSCSLLSYSMKPSLIIRNVSSCLRTLQQPVTLLEHLPCTVLRGRDACTDLSLD